MDIAAPPSDTISTQKFPSLIERYYTQLFAVGTLIFILTKWWARPIRLTHFILPFPCRHFRSKRRHLCLSSHKWVCIQSLLLEAWEILKKLQIADSLWFFFFLDFRLMVIGLAPSHPIVVHSKPVKEIKFQSEHRDFSKNVVRGAKKRVWLFPIFWTMSSLNSIYYFWSC